MSDREIKIEQKVRRETKILAAFGFLFLIEKESQSEASARAPGCLPQLALLCCGVCVNGREGGKEGGVVCVELR